MTFLAMPIDRHGTGDGPGPTFYLIAMQGLGEGAKNSRIFVPALYFCAC
jgi:hypothetical protein